MSIICCQDLKDRTSGSGSFVYLLLFSAARELTRPLNAALWLSSDSDAANMATLRPSQPPRASQEGGRLKTELQKRTGADALLLSV